MKVKVIKIGNSKGIRLSQSLLQQYQINDEVVLKLNEEGILIKPSTKTRKNWEQQFRDAVIRETAEDNSMLELQNKFDKEEWTW
jgi:antitoxin MazE